MQAATLTLSAAAVALNEKLDGTIKVTRASVLAAAKVRNVPVVESRIPAHRIADIYFAHTRGQVSA